MDASTSGTSSVQYHNIAEQPIAATIVNSTFQRQVRHCFGNATPGEFPLSANPSIVLHVLTGCNLDPQDLATLEASVSLLGVVYIMSFIWLRIDGAAHFLYNVFCRLLAHSFGSLQTLHPIMSSP